MMKETEKKIEWVRESYWEEFHKAYPDPSRFRSFIAADLTLTKIFNFCSVPSIWEGVKKFPFDEKIRELDKITSEEREYLSEAHWRINDKDKQAWLDYLSNLFDVVCSTVMFKRKLDSDNEQQGRRYNQEQILDIVEASYRDYISVNEKMFLSKTEYIWRINKWFPLFGMQVHFKYDSQTKKKGVFAAINHWESPPAEIDPVSSWDIYSVVCFQEHHFDELFDSASRTFTIQHYYKGKPYLSKPFQFQIAKRYEPLLKKVFSQKGLREKGFDYRDGLPKLFELALKYDSTGGAWPAGYFGQYLQFNEIFGEYKSEAGDLACKSFCKEKKRYDGKLPCEYETENGFCKDPQKKPRFLSDIETSGGSLDEKIDTEDGESEFRKDRVDDNALDPEMTLTDKEGGEVPALYSLFDSVLDELRKDERLNQILAKINEDEPLSDADRQYHFRWIEKQKKQIATK
jgi:hypothetical protein